ncbi:MAG: thioredoxin fold domain-containing protein [Calditrichaceae bacterium]
MWKKNLFIGLILILATNTAFAEGMRFIDEKKPFSEILQMASQKDQLVMVDFYTDWCSWCKVLDEKTYSTDEVGALAENFLSYKINAEKGDGIELAKKYNITGFPSILFINAAGEEVDRLIGYYPPENFIPVVTDILNNKNTYLSLIKEYKTEPNNPKVAYPYAQKLYDRGQHTEALNIFDSIIVSDPENKSGVLGPVYLQKGMLALREGDVAEAITDLNLVTGKYNQFEESHLAYAYLAMISERSDEPEEAIRLLKEAVTRATNPDYQTNYRGRLALLYLDQKQFGQADGLIAEIEKNSEDKVSAAELRLNFYLKQNDKKNAEILMQKLFPRIENDSNALNQIAWAWVENESYSETALNWAEKAVTLSDRNEMILDTLAELYVLKGDVKKAIEIEREAMERTTSKRNKSEFQKKIMDWESRTTM